MYRPLSVEKVCGTPLQKITEISVWLCAPPSPQSMVKYQFCLRRETSTLDGGEWERSTYNLFQIKTQMCSKTSVHGWQSVVYFETLFHSLEHASWKVSLTNIQSTDSKVSTTFDNIINSTTEKYCSIVFI